VLHAAPHKPSAAIVVGVVIGALVILAAFGLRNRFAIPTPATPAPIALPPAIAPAEPETRGVPPPPQLGVTPSTTQTVTSDEVTVPNFAVFDSVSAMKAVLQHAGLTGAFVAASEPPPSKDKEFKYAGQDPAPDTKVKSGSTVTIAIYQKFGGHDSD
jgi:hypothetical protein